MTMVMIRGSARASMKTRQTSPSPSRAALGATAPSRECPV
jgi:hypothetical protein